jgi:hypothetical protein
MNILKNIVICLILSVACSAIACEPGSVEKKVSHETGQVVNASGDVVQSLSDSLIAWYLSLDITKQSAKDFFNGYLIRIMQAYLNKMHVLALKKQIEFFNSSIIDKKYLGSVSNLLNKDLKFNEDNYFQVAMHLLDDTTSPFHGMSFSGKPTEAHRINKELLTLLSTIEEGRDEQTATFITMQALQKLEEFIKTQK